MGQVLLASWKVEENRIIKSQNAILKKLQEVFGQIGNLLKQWKDRLNDIRRKQRSYSTNGEYDKSNRGTTGTYDRDVSEDGIEGQTTHFISEAESKIAGIKQRVARAVSNIAKYRGTVGIIGKEGWRKSDIERRKSAMERINGEVEQRELVIAETERGIAELQKRLEKARNVDERFEELKARRADGGNAGNVGVHGEGIDTERFHHSAEGSEIQTLQGQLNE